MRDQKWHNCAVTELTDSLDGRNETERRTDTENGVTIQSTQYEDGALYTVMYHANHSGTYVGYVRGEFANTECAFFQEVSAAFRFPYYFGWNWAALDDCLTDLEWLSFSSLLLVVDRAELLFRDEPDAKVCVNLLKKHLLAAASYWKERNIKFEVILNTHMSRA